MTIRSNNNFEEAAAEGDVELVLTAVTYNGDRSMYQSENLRSNGGYPALDGFQSGETKIVKLPSRNLGWWERHSDFEIDYTEETLAEAILSMNYLPEEVTGPGYDPELRREFLDKLGIEPATDGEGWREQLREVAGVDPDEEDDGGDSDPVMEQVDQRVERLTSEVSRSVLIQVANSYDGIDEYLDEVEKDSVSHLSQIEAAEFLQDKDDDAVDRRIEKAETGQEL